LNKGFLGGDNVTIFFDFATEAIPQPVTGIDPSQIKRLQSRGINNVDDLITCSLYKLCIALKVDVISAKTLKSNAQNLQSNNKIILDELKFSYKKLKKNKPKHKDKKRRKNYKPLKKLKMW